MSAPAHSDGSPASRRSGEAAAPAPPAVSIVTSTHDAARFVERYVAALEAQTFADWECLVVDDGSTDDTVERLRRRTRGDRRFRLFERPRSGFPAANRHHALGLARGELVAFCDQDDFWWPAKLEAQVAALARHPDATFCHTGRCFAGPGEAAGHLEASAPSDIQASAPSDIQASEPSDIQASAPSDIQASAPPDLEGRLVVDSVRRALLGSCAVTCSSVVARRRAVLEVGGIHPGLRGVDDYHLWLRLAAVGPFLWLRSPLVTCTLHGGNLSSSPAVLAAGFETMVADLEAGHRRGAPGAVDERVLRAVRAQSFKARGVAEFIERPARAAFYLLRSWAVRPKKRTAKMAAGVLASTLVSRRRRRDLWRRVQEQRSRGLLAAGRRAVRSVDEASGGPEVSARPRVVAS